jgi:hypothetical protein
VLVQLSPRSNSKQGGGDGTTALGLEMRGEALVLPPLRSCLKRGWWCGTTALLVLPPSPCSGRQG